MTCGSCGSGASGPDGRAGGREGRRARRAVRGGLSLWAGRLIAGKPSCGRSKLGRLGGHHRNRALAALPNVRIIGVLTVVGVYDGGTYCCAGARKRPRRRSRPSTSSRQRLWRIFCPSLGPRRRGDRAAAGIRRQRPAGHHAGRRRGASISTATPLRRADVPWCSAATMRPRGRLQT